MWLDPFGMSNLMSLSLPNEAKTVIFLCTLGYITGRLILSRIRTVPFEDKSHQDTEDDW